MNVSANLLEYLKKNDSAELIGIGTFRVEYTPSSISPITNTLTPPSRTIKFYNQINDDLGFVNELAKKEFISVETAMKWIKQYSDSIKEKIETANSCKLGELGIFSKGATTGYAFVPTTGLNLLDSAFAFSTIKSVKTFDQGNFIKPIITKEQIIEQSEYKKIENEKNPIEITIIGITSNQTSTKEHSPLSTLKEKYEQNIEEPPTKEESTNLIIEHEKTKEIVFELKEEIKRDDVQMEEAQKEVEQRLIDLKEENGEELGEKEGLDISDEDSFNYKNSKRFRKNVKRRKKLEKKERKQRNKRNKILWVILSTIVLLALLVSAFLVLAHYMCWTKDIKELKPLSEKLNNYIKPKCESGQKTIIIPIQAPIAIEAETITTETPTELSSIEKTETKAQNPTKPIQPKKVLTTKEKPLKPTGEKDVPPTPSPEIDYSTPILMQPVSRLGFDVVGGTYENSVNAQQAARKARSLGYDSYIITKSQDEKTKYYVSYGSRRTMREANSFMSTIIKRHGSSGYYIISR
ncbi:MAG: SPOR domain-containing protein [Bacteroidales bacterium]|nr:SPOR domain-containing protein [Bacteroidales bacterium]